MNTPQREFIDSPAVRSNVPLLIGLFGPSGCGKSWSALRLATGIQSVVGGEIGVIDTEAKRMLHYADNFKFRHLDFKAPFGSLDYLAAIKHFVDKGTKTIVIDSMSHEHSGEGGYLLTQDAELDRFAGNDENKRQRNQMRAWIKPARLRGQMIQGILQLAANFIFTFRAKEKVKPEAGGAPKALGFMPIASEELLFEMTACCFLPSKSDGTPVWQSEMAGELFCMKLPQQFRHILNGQLSEDMGKQLAEWAKGGSSPAPKVTPQSAGGDDGKRKAWNAVLASCQNDKPQAEELWAKLTAQHKRDWAAIEAACVGQKG